jgi:hypothetical protein
MCNLATYSSCLLLLYGRTRSPYKSSRRLHRGRPTSSPLAAVAAAAYIDRGGGGGDGGH